MKTIPTNNSLDSFGASVLAVETSQQIAQMAFNVPKFISHTLVSDLR